ncbi:putative reverse transcriptase zinc-binding domain-containing protein [Helianthus annuus]|nr:putative reverse transcriptase zinc-binding domain-containing protein [Helianthus annuus]
MDTFPSLFKLEERKMCMVSNILTREDMITSVNWSWKKDPESEIELKESDELMEVIRHVSLIKCVDDWRWNGDVNRCFSVDAIRRWLSGKNVDNGDVVFEWCKWLPDKCNIFMWRALLDRLTTKLALRRRNIHADNALCVLCEDGEELVDHLFTGCGIYGGVGRHIKVVWSTQFFFASSLKDVVEIHNTDGLSNLRKEIVRGAVIACCLRIWKARNEQFF